MVVNGTYIHKNSTVAAKVPQPTDLQPGEIAINIADSILYTKTAGGAIIALNQSYTRTESDARYIPQGILPITRIGSLDTTPLPVAPTTGFSFSVSTAIPVMLGGKFFNMAAGTYTINNVDNGATTNYANKTINVYVALVNGNVVFTYYTTAQAEAYALVYIGTITTTAAITAINVSKVSRLDIYRVSLTSKGSAIPVTSGLPNAAGTFDPSWSI